MREPILEIVLEDDDSPYGGISFFNETLRDFLCDVSDVSNCPRAEEIKYAIISLLADYNLV